MGVTAGIVGITATASHSLRKLQDFIGKIKDAPSLVAALKTNLENVNAVISGLRNALNKPTIIDAESKRLLDDLKI